MTTLDRILTCDECGTKWHANWGNTWLFMNGRYDTKQCRDDAIARWKVTHSRTEDADAEPDAQAVAHLEAVEAERYGGA